MIARARIWLWLVAVAITQGVFNTTGAGLHWVITGKGSAPDPDEPLSARVGRAAVKGRAWGLWAERVIDGIFGAGHCRASRR